MVDDDVFTRRFEGRAGSFKVMLVVASLVAVVTVLWRKKLLHGRRGRIYIAAFVSAGLAAVTGYLRLVGKSLGTQLNLSLTCIQLRIELQLFQTRSGWLPSSA